VVCPTPAPQIVFQEYVRAVTEHTPRLQRLDQELQEHVKSWRLPPVVEALQALRGVQCTVAVPMVAEMGDLSRFDTPRELMKFVGLSPSEYSSGARRQQGAMTQAGNTHARRALVEGAWAYRYPAPVSRHLQWRLEKQPKVSQDISWKAHVRLGKRYRQLGARGKHANSVTVAIARARAGFMWAMARQLPVAAEVSRTDRHCPQNTEGFRRASEEAQPRCGVTLGSVRRLVQDTRAESEAGSRRTQGRWYPTHG
jgi:hypothetical protein